uniref:CSON006508 protein n=1 Tax=Culicoides sonorensis TaxID=179676 RepID=A0A336KF14_CULSO
MKMRQINGKINKKVFLSHNPIDVEKNPQNEESLKKTLKKNFTEYCDNSTVHGVKYIGQRRKIQRIVWIIICIGLLCGCGTLIHTIIGKWRQNPLVFLLDQKVTPISQITFPAVTLCPQRVPNSNKFNYTNFLMRFLEDDNRNFTKKEFLLFDAVSKICHSILIKDLVELEPKLEDIPLFNNEESIEIMEEYVLTHYLKLFFCKGVLPNVTFWECNLRFTRIYLREGLCYTFNLLPKDEIFNEGVLYPLANEPNLVRPENEPSRSNFMDVVHDIGKQTEPYSVRNRRDRLHIRSRTYDDFTDEKCKPDMFIFVHNPDEIPWDRTSSAYLIDDDYYEKNLLSIEPVVVRTDNNLKYQFTYQERGCYYSDERKLKYFKSYNENNCELECITNATSQPDRLNCTFYWMPRTPDMKLCHLSQYMMGYEMQLNERLIDDIEKCECLPACNTVDYNVRVLGSHTPYFVDKGYKKEDIAKFETNEIAALWKKHMEEKLYLGMNKSYKFDIPLSEAISKTNLTVDFDIWNWRSTEIELHYEDSQFLAMRRHLAYTFADFVSQVGGILGCFLGISIFSIIEILYFWTVRLYQQHKTTIDRNAIQVEKNQISILTVLPKFKFESGKF